MTNVGQVAEVMRLMGVVLRCPCCLAKPGEPHFLTCPVGQGYVVLVSVQGRKP